MFCLGCSNRHLHFADYFRIIGARGDKSPSTREFKVCRTSACGVAANCATLRSSSSGKSFSVIFQFTSVSLWFRQQRCCRKKPKRNSLKNSKGKIFLIAVCSLVLGVWSTLLIVSFDLLLYSRSCMQKPNRYLPAFSSPLWEAEWGRV